MTYEARQVDFLNAPPQATFDALTRPEGLVRWFHSAAKIDLRPGGAFAFDWLQGYHMDGTVLACAPPTSVRFLWRDTTPSGSIVETQVDFHVPPKDGGTLLELRHSGFQDPAHFAECASRWAYYLMNLKSQLEHRQDLRSPFDW